MAAHLAFDDQRARWVGAVLWCTPVGAWAGPDTPQPLTALHAANQAGHTYAISDSPDGGIVAAAGIYVTVIVVAAVINGIAAVTI